MSRPIAYDATHLVSRLNRVSTTGMDRIDLSYARHLTSQARICCGTHFGLFNPHLFSPSRVGDLVDFMERRIGERELIGDDMRWKMLRSWLVDDSSAQIQDPAPTTLRPSKHLGLQKQIQLRVAHDRGVSIPENAIYLNIAQHAFEHHWFFNWLDRRKDVLPVFFIHDLLPLDYPEFFPEQYEFRFKRRVETMLRHSRAILTTTTHVAERIRAEFAAHGARNVPILVEPPASPLDDSHTAHGGPELEHTDYFVAISTIEPRKNHILLLNIWRELAASMPKVPKLVIIGLRGWGNNQTISMIERSKSSRAHVYTTSELSSGGLKLLIAHSNAVLMPSFAEGYGLSVVEALSLGKPVIASDIPVFREVAQNCATFLSPIDGAAWLDAVTQFSDRSSIRYIDAVKRASNFVKPTWDSYFSNVDAFLENL